jgi:hypothetical protein
MKSIELTIEILRKNDNKMQVLRAVFNTPNSEIDRKISAELQLNTNAKKEMRILLRSPWTRFNALASLSNQEKERALVFEVNVNESKLFGFDVGIESNTVGLKREYRPRVKIQLSPKSEPIALRGSVSVSLGRKVQIDLEGNQKQLLRGSFLREDERKSNDFRIASDLTLNLAGIELKINSLGDKASKHMITDLTVEYKLKSEKKESLKFSAKLQNLTHDRLNKMSAFGELTSTQFPKLNFHLGYNLRLKPFERIENDLTVAWNQKFNDKFHVLQVSKYSKLVLNSEQKFKNTLVLEITPLDMNYELRANVEINRRGSEGSKYNMELIGKDRNGRKENDIKRMLEYKHISRSLSQLSMDASLKCANRDMSYHLELKEVSLNHYNGNTSIQWQSRKVATLHFNYK